MNTDYLDPNAKALDESVPNRSTGRWFRAVAEEAGEVVGAYNKMEDGNTLKPKTPEDILEEMAQLTGCIFVVAHRIGFTAEDVLNAADEFMAAKASAMRAMKHDRR